MSTGALLWGGKGGGREAEKRMILDAYYDAL